MGQTVIEKILSQHAGKTVFADDIAGVAIDLRTARDFGGANVVKNLKENYSDHFVDISERTYFTFDCNVPATTTGYADNQQICRNFAKENKVKVFDINQGIGSHVLMEEGLATPGSIIVGTDSHLNILSAVGAFGQGMGDVDIAFVFKTGFTWFEVPKTIKLNLEGHFHYPTTAKDLAIFMLKKLGSSGLLGCAAELCGPAAESLTLAERITLSSLATEMGAIALFFPPSDDVLEYCKKRSNRNDIAFTEADADASYVKEITLNIDNLVPYIAEPNSPSNGVKVADAEGRKVDSGFIGSCTNGRYDDFVIAASFLKGKKIHENFMLKVVPSTAEVYDRMLDDGLIKLFRDAGALISNPGCGGCASGQIGIIGQGETQISTSNRNFPGKQGKGDTYLAGPAVVAATALKGEIIVPEAEKMPEDIPSDNLYERTTLAQQIDLTKWPVNMPKELDASSGSEGAKGSVIRGRARAITNDSGAFISDIDTDMIFHNRYLAIKEISEMAQYTFDNLKGYEDFAKTAKEGDIVFVGNNFGSGSSRQQAVDCFKALGIKLIVAHSFGAIYFRNGVNSGLGLLSSKDHCFDIIREGDDVSVDLTTGVITNHTLNKEIQGEPFFDVQKGIFNAGDLFIFGKKIA